MRSDGPMPIQPEGDPYDLDYWRDGYSLAVDEGQKALNRAHAAEDRAVAAERERDAALDRERQVIEQWGWQADRADRAEAALDAVRALHQPDVSWLKPEAQDDPKHRNVSACRGCRAPGIGGYSYGQCPTRHALATAQPVEGSQQ